MKIRFWLRMFLLSCLLGGGFDPQSGSAAQKGNESIPVLSDHLPSFPVSCELTGEDLRPDAVLRGKPAVLYFTDVALGTAGELARFLAGMESEYAPWITWVGVLVGPAEPSEVRRVHEESPVHFSRCFTDTSGAWRDAFRLERLPAAVLVTDEGYVLRRQYGLQAGDGDLLSREFDRLVKAAKLVGRPAFDFSLPEAGTGKPTTLADVAQKDYTILFSLRSDCGECFEELKVLERFRDENPERVSIVAVYHDADGEPPAAPRPPHDAPHPDHAVRDPEMSYADRYFVTGLPFLLVIDTEGKIALARKGFLSTETDSLAREMSRIVGRAAPPGKLANSFAELRRIRAEGLAFLSKGQFGMAVFFLERALELNPYFHTLQPLLAEAYEGEGKRREAALAYTRYLAAEPKAPDREKIEERIGLLTTGR